MTTTPNNQPDLSDMVAPGQEDLIDNFLKEIEQEQAALQKPEQTEPQDEETLLAGKYKTQEDLEAAYLNAQKKIQELSEGKQETEKPLVYTPEQVVDTYGQEKADRFKEMGVDLAAIMAKADLGEDITEHYPKLAEGFGVPEKTVEMFVFKNGGKYAAPKQQAPERMSQADEAAIINNIGGQESFNQVSEWMTNNLTPNELEGYNAAINTGNKDIAGFAINQMKSRYDAANNTEPTLISGGTNKSADVFTSDPQATAAIGAIDKATGRPRYQVDPEYRKWVEDTMRRSSVYGV
tara:strand:- start:537 stop:1415 length:879 start_codon:yes stop_codon:yes gene_type:complete